MLWWDKNHPFIKLLGIDQRHGFATYDLTVLMLIFLHRAVLKKFGLWKSSVAEEFTEGCFLLDKCDDKTSQLIEYNLIQSLTSMKSESDDDAKIYRFGSREHLIDDMHLNCKVIFRHEINDNIEIPKVRSVYKHRYELLTADEELFKDNNGKMMIKLLQDNIRLRLRPIHCDNISQTYPVDKLIIADCTLEEPSDFCSSSIIMMSIKRYISFMKKYFRNMIPEHKFPRKIADVYKYMFLCDFINFLILLFGFTEFAVICQSLLQL